ncbi:MAG TPA: hypothetical protein VIS56_01295 [Candidatus Saccharimonadales bacterium]
MSSPKGTNLTKDVIYIDVDDEITAMIDKVRASDKKIIALVLPKRATVLQSIVNMKLLKRAAIEAKKNLVLITSESGLMPLAGSVGMHVAKSLNSRPEIPDGPERVSFKIETADDEDDDGNQTMIDKDKTVGELSGVVAPTDEDDEDAIELDDEDQSEGQKGAADDSKFKKGANKKFKIPNFNKFRVLLILGVVGVLLLGMVGYAAVAVWPRAKITIKTDSTSVDSSVVLTLKIGSDAKLDTEKAIIPAQTQEVKKTAEQQVPATGQVNNGEKASGSVEMTAQDCDSPISTPSDVSAGSGISAGGNTYITQKKASFSPTSVSGGCVYFKSGSISIVAQSGGAKFNTDSTTFTVAGRSGVTATGSASGGTDNITKIVTQADIDAAKQKITAQDTLPIKQELKSALIGRGLYAMDATFNTGTPETKLSAEANTPAENVTVTQVIAYTMHGVSQDDIEKIVAKSVEKKIDAEKQTITNYGLDDAVLSAQGVNAGGASVSMQTTVVAGTELNAETIKKQVAGKKAGGAKEIIEANPGVTSVVVEYSPFWVGSIPKKTDKITVIIQEPKAVSADEESSP